MPVCSGAIQTGATTVHGVSEGVPSSALRADATFRLGEISYNTGNYAEAEERFKRVINEFFDNSLAGEAAYWIGESYLKSGDLPEALKYYRLVLDKYSRSRLADYAAYSLGWTYEKSGEYVRAIESYNLLLTTYVKASLRPRPCTNRAGILCSEGVQEGNRVSPGVPARDRGAG